MSKKVQTYPNDGQYERWKQRSDDMGMSLSEWVSSMVEAGSKKFDRTVEPDETVGELREQRNDLRNELEAARNRIERLETQVYGGQRGSVLEFIQDNPGATYDDVRKHLIDDVPEDADRHLNALEAEGEIVRDGDHIYPITDGEISE
jgi:hypothetical protein